MQLKPIIQGIAVVWLLVFVASFFSLQVAETDDGATSGLARVVSFLTWQAIALMLAVVGALTARFALQRGVEGVKLLGYVPLAFSVFLVASFVALVGFRFYVAPLFE
jgi:hypothetical protein